MEDQNQNNQGLEDILIKTNEDLSNFEVYLSKDGAELVKELETTSTALKQSYETLVKELEKSADAAAKGFEKGVFQFYHENKSEVDQNLNIVNDRINSTLKTARETLNFAMRASKDPLQRAALQAALLQVVDLSREYNFRFKALKMRLALENAGINVKETFQKIENKLKG